MSMSVNMDMVNFGGQRISIKDVVDLALARKRSGLSDETGFCERVNKGAVFLEKLLQDDGVIYGVTTGYGDSCTVVVPLDKVDKLPLHLTRFHGCGLGRFFDKATARAVLATRLSSLAQGYSGVRMDLLQQFCHFLNEDIVPLIPEEGSVGASGDLTPLSYVAGAIVGEREVDYRGRQQLASEAMAEAGISPLQLRPKEGLAVMNGTAVMTAVACMAYSRAEYLSRLTTRITAMASLALKGNSHHFDDILFSVKGVVLLDRPNCTKNPN